MSLEVYVVHTTEYKEDLWGYPQGKGIKIIGEIFSIRLTEDAAREDVKNNSHLHLDYTKKIVT